MLKIEAPRTVTIIQMSRNQYERFVKKYQKYPRTLVPLVDIVSHGDLLEIIRTGADLNVGLTGWTEHVNWPLLKDPEYCCLLPPSLVDLKKLTPEQLFAVGRGAVQFTCGVNTQAALSLVHRTVFKKKDILHAFLTATPEQIEAILNIFYTRTPLEQPNGLPAGVLLLRSRGTRFIIINRGCAVNFLQAMCWVQKQEQKHDTVIYTCNSTAGLCVSAAGGSTTVIITKYQPQIQISTVEDTIWQYSARIPLPVPTIALRSSLVPDKSPFIRTNDPDLAYFHMAPSLRPPTLPSKTKIPSVTKSLDWASAGGHTLLRSRGNILLIGLTLHRGNYIRDGVSSYLRLTDPTVNKICADLLARGIKMRQNSTGAALQIICAGKSPLRLHLPPTEKAFTKRINSTVPCEVTVTVARDEREWHYYDAVAQAYFLVVAATMTICHTVDLNRNTITYAAEIKKANADALAVSEYLMTAKSYPHPTATITYGQRKFPRK